jgi:catechol 2,3-dioxygenase-like lactoylglutathione lyase family enzyme
MVDHIGVRVKDLAQAVRLYAAILAPLGHAAGAKGEGYAGFGSGFWLHEKTKSQAAGCHVAFRAETRAAVDAFHAAGLKAGGRDNGAPGLRLDYGPTYYAAFILDADGNNVEAVCMK